jgi:hypothetical protein
MLNGACASYRFLLRIGVNLSRIKGRTLISPKSDECTGGGFILLKTVSGVGPILNAVMTKREVFPDSSVLTRFLGTVPLGVILHMTTHIP